jgi:hypothetical protein
MSGRLGEAKDGAMNQPRRRIAPAPCAEIIDFDQALLNRCTPELRAELLAEATLLAQAFAPEGGPDELTAMARILSTGGRDQEFGRARALKLAAALRRLAKDPAATWRLLGRCG